MSIRSFGRKPALLVSAMAAMGALVGCSSGGGSASINTQGGTTKNLPPAVAADVSRSSPVPATLVETDNAFGIQIFGQLRKVDAGKNVFVAPPSIDLALQIVYNGAAGTTQQAMAQTLGLQSLSTTGLNTENAALEASLVNTDSQIQYTVANSLWVHQSGAGIAPAFLQTNTQYYGSQIGDLAGAPANINAWVSNQTNGKITNVVTNDIQNATAAIINTVYFKGPWTSPFNVSNTTSSPFTLADGSTVTCNMMHQTGLFGYLAGSNFQAVRLPYGQQRLSMYVFLPNSGVTLDSFLTQLTSANWDSWMTQFLPVGGNLALPRFTTQYNASLIPSLQALGMGVAFDPTKANFSALSSGFYINYAQHATYLAVDEAGTEAAGYSGVIGGTAAPVVVFTFTVDHPFFCAIRDDQTGVILFMGAIDNPTLYPAS